MSEVKDITWAADGSDTAVADYVAGILAAKPNAMIAIPGGKTPQAIITDLAARPLDWSDVTVLLTDDRMVPNDHPHSNQLFIDTTLDPTGARIVGLVEGGRVPPLDLVWLGMGTDGHVASLFPKMTAYELPGARAIRTVPDPLPSEAPFERLSLNVNALWGAAEIILVVRGAEKRALLEKVFAEDSDLPVAMVLKRARGPVTIFWSAE